MNEYIDRLFDAGTDAGVSYLESLFTPKKEDPATIAPPAILVQPTQAGSGDSKTLLYVGGGLLALGVIYAVTRKRGK